MISEERVARNQTAVHCAIRVLQTILATKKLFDIRDQHRMKLAFGSFYAF